MDKLEVKKSKIQEKGLDKINDYFDLDMQKLSILKPEVLKHLNAMARLGMQFEREMNIGQRKKESNYMRIAKLVLIPGALFIQI